MNLRVRYPQFSVQNTRSHQTIKVQGSHLDVIQLSQVFRVVIGLVILSDANGNIPLLRCCKRVVKIRPSHD